MARKEPYKVLYISYDGLTDPLGQSQVLPYILGLNKKGYLFTLISFEKPEKFEKGKTSIENLCKENEIEWHPLLYTKKPPILSTLKDIRGLKTKIKALHAAKMFDMVHCRSYIAALAGLWMKKKWGVKFIFDMRGFWADERVDGGIWNLKNPAFKAVYQYFKKKETQFLQVADHTISLTINAKKEIESWNKNVAPISVIPCCVDLELFDPATINPEEVNRVKNELGITPGQKIISYIGSIGTWYLLDEMLDFFKAFLEKNKEAVFLFVTKDNKKEIQDRLVKKGIAPEAVRIVAGERKQMPLFISVSDYSIFFIKPAFSKKASSPTKQGEIMAMGIPVICNDNVGDTSVVVNKYKSGVVVKEFSEAAYKNAIDQLLECNFNKAEIRTGAKEFYSLEKGIQKYSSVYEKLTMSDC